MKITNISLQARDKNRVNVSVDGKYRFSLDVFQVGELGLKIGREYTEKELSELEDESQFGKLYARALEYCMMRPRAIKEVQDYLWRKTRPTKKIAKPHNSKKLNQHMSGNKTTNSSASRTDLQAKVVEVPGVKLEIAERVLERLIEKKYLDDEKFAKFWLEHRFLQKGASLRRLRLELSQKGIDKELSERLIGESVRSDADELQKIIARKHYRYPDRQKFMQYLTRQGFSYDDVKSALGGDEN